MAKRNSNRKPAKDREDADTAYVEALLKSVQNKATDAHSRKSLDEADALLTEICALRDAKRTAGETLMFFCLGALLKDVVDWPAVAKEINRIRKRREAVTEETLKRARRAKDLLDNEKRIGGHYYLRSQGVKAVAEKMDVHPKTLDRWLKLLSEKSH